MRYASRYPSLTGFPATVRLEPGVQSGTHPTVTLPITSLVGETLHARGVVEQLGVTGLTPFEMTLLHFRRTFIEKLFAIHGKVERLKNDGHPLGRDARHYADLFVLAGQPEVLEMIDSDEYRLICTDYDRTSRSYFPKTYRPPKHLRFGASDALFPSDALRRSIEHDYEAECARLFYRPHPSFQEVLDRFTQIRGQL
jgi:hypothetical protein